MGLSTYWQRRLLRVGAAFAALAAALCGAWAQAAPARIEVVPVRVVEGDAAPAAPQTWMYEFPAYAMQFWREASGGRVVPQLSLGPGVVWVRCPDCRLTPFDRRDLEPWLQELDYRAQRDDGAAAYLLLFPKGSLEGAGFFLPEAWLSGAYGFDGFAVLAADGPQAALHELGHWLGLPDRYKPHDRDGTTALTLMGWIDEPVAPLDPVLRVRQGWAVHAVTEPGERPQTVHLGVDNVIELRLHEGSIWLGLQPIPGRDGANGYLFEVDATDARGRFERLDEALLSAATPEAGIATMPVFARDLIVAWSFRPDARVLTATYTLVPADPLLPWPVRRYATLGLVAVGLLAATVVLGLWWRRR